MSYPKKLKVAVLRENLKMLTGDWLQAIILNQFIYWSEKIYEVDDFLKEEQIRSEKDGKDLGISLQHGWIYKTTTDIISETMIDVNRKTIRKALKNIIEKGWLHERNNPQHKWDRTLQYRPNIVKIQQDLYALGYVLDQYPLQCPKKDNRMSDNGQWNVQNVPMECPKCTNGMSIFGQAIPEITTEITTEITYSDVVASPPEFEDSQNEKYKSFMEKVKKEICKPKKDKGTHLDSNQQLTDEWRQVAFDWKIHPGWIELRWRDFKDYWIVGEGKNITKKDWLSTWRNNCRSAPSKFMYAPPEGIQADDQFKLSNEDHEYAKREIVLGIGNNEIKDIRQKLFMSSPAQYESWIKDVEMSIENGYLIIKTKNNFTLDYIDTHLKSWIEEEVLLPVLLKIKP